MFETSASRESEHRTRSDGLHLITAVNVLVDSIQMNDVSELHPKLVATFNGYADAL